jgi:hypothetical protein
LAFAEEGKEKEGKGKKERRGREEEGKEGPVAKAAELRLKI